MEAREEASSSSAGVVERSAEHPLEYYPSTSTDTLPHVEERVKQDSRDRRFPVGTCAPNPGGGCQGVDSVAGSGREQSEISTQPPPSTQTGVNTQPKTLPPTTGVLALHCKMCEAPPMVTTRPTVTTCGHLFCSEYVPRLLSTVTRRLTPHQVHYATRIIHVQMSRVQQLPLVVLFI